MKFSEVAYKNKEELRAKLLEIINLDVEACECFFSSRNFAFVFSGGCFPKIIRAGINPSRTTHNIMSELMWVDDLKLHMNGIAHMIPFDDGSIEKELKVGDDIIVISQFRKVNGAVPEAHERDKDYIKLCGEYLGQIHRTSKQEVLDGFKFKRYHWNEILSYNPENLKSISNQKVIDECNKLINEIKSIPKTADVYGMIHGDFQYKNTFRDWDNVWIFDFDDCCYGYYMIDIGSFITGLYSDGKYKPEMPRKESSMEALKYFREGYEKYMQLPDYMWNYFIQFLRLRTVSGMILFDNLDFPEEIKKKTIDFLSSVIISDDYFDAFDRLKRR